MAGTRRAGRHRRSIAVALTAFTLVLGGIALSQEDATALEARVGQLERRVVELLAELTKVRGERDQLQRLLDRLITQVDHMEADRLLLTELRKELPETRAEAEAYLARLRRLALISDPVRLAPVAARMIEAGPVYLDWRDDSFESAEARARAFTESGAHGFQTAFSNFRNAVLLTVSNRIEGTLILIE